MVTLTIDGKLPNLNDYTKACRANRYAGAEMKRKAEEKITAHIWEQLDGSRFTSPVRLGFRWYEPNKRRDLDNICLAKKFILDALVSAGTIPSDNWSGVHGFTDDFFVDKDCPRIEVDIFEAE